MDWKRDNYYTTRAGEKVRLICTDNSRRYPLVFADDIGQLFTATNEGRNMEAEVPTAFDITGPWVEPVKPLEGWLNTYGIKGEGWMYSSEKAAVDNANSDNTRIAVHMREVQS